MKAFCLQLSIAVCVILSTQSLTAQLTITCPDPDPQDFTCAEDIPAQAGDSLGFLSLEGASISGVTGMLNIVYSDFSPPEQTGCPDDAINRIRIFRFTDESDADEIMCNIRFRIERLPDADVIACDDVTVTLDETGNATLDASDVTFAPTLSCPGDISITDLEITEFFCNNTIDSPIENFMYFENECDEEITCNFNVTVEDNLPPSITCPANISVDLDPCVCEDNIVFDDATGMDECAGEGSVAISRIDDTGLSSGDLFPEGLTVLTFEAEDMSGNTSRCNLQIRLTATDPGSLFCKADQNISLNEFCAAKVTPQMAIKDPNCDIDSYRIELYDHQGYQLPSDTITAEYLGEVVTARAYYECYDNFCTLQFTVEDKMPPMINCNDMTISCSDFIEFPIPTISDNCGTFSSVLLNQVPKDVACDSEDIDKIITRTYGVRDESGDIIETCEQEISIRKFDISEVDGPEVVVTVACDSLMDLDANGNPDPSVTGAPSLNGIDLYPQADLYCNVALTYDDMVFPGTGCGKTLIRTWTVVNWYCGQDGMMTFKQSISVIDTVGPEITAPDNVTISSSMFSCETSYTIPEPDMSDNCQDDIQLDIIYPGGIALDTTSVTVELELGENEITYRAGDRCGNMSLATYTVTVVDMVQPVAICESGLSFSLDGNGMAILRATTFDNGSLDGCSDALLEIARMTTNCGIESDTIFGSEVVLCCEDIGQDVMIMLRVTDDAGNSNQCMASIQVTDESGPSFMSGLPDITISNDYPVDTSDLSAFGFIEQNVDFPGEINLDADVVEFSGPNVNAVVQDNCSINTVSESKNADISMCQTGTIIRTFIVSDAFGSADTIQQEITLIAESEFSESDITFPDDTTLTDICSPDLDPQSLESYPRYAEGFSSMVSYTNEDDTLIFTSNGCFVLERIWYVSDWCNKPDGLTFATFIDTQMISVVDNVAPEITSSCADSTICSFVSACGPHPVNLSATGSDNCTEADNLEWSFTINFADERPDSLGSGNNFAGGLPVGVNTITWSVDDGCGNTDVCSFDFTIESCLSPQPVCLLGQEFYIAPIDTTGDNIPDINGVRITADMLDGGSSHPCGKDISVSFSADINDTIRIFTCDTIGTVPMMLFATDEDGKSDFCNANITVSDTSSAMYCGMGMVAGVIFGNEIDFVSDVSVSLEGAEMISITDENGFFAFPEMAPGGAYSVVPSKVDIARNGVSTADLVLIQRHLLEIQTFESPYKLIAADVNQSGHISASDLISVRKLILGLNDEFPNSKTWAFVPGNHVFLDPADPWASPIPEQYNIYHLAGHNELDFIGIKLGDVNETVEMNSMFSTSRSIVDFEYKMNGSNIEVYATRDMDFAALFSGIYIDDKELETLELHVADMVLNHHVTEDGILNILLSSPENINVSNGEKIFTFGFSSELSSEFIGVLDFIETSSEIAYEDGTSSNVGYRFISEIPSMILKQNNPNPWVEQTSFEVIMPKAEQVLFRILDISGKEVLKRNLNLDKGENEIVIKDSEMPLLGGMYIYELGTSFGIESKKMMLLAH